jgi:galactose mutarotase-like enzyme
MGKTGAAGKENVLIQTGPCSVTLLPHLGGKIASIRIGEQELLQSPLATYEARSRTMRFDASDASGWDECLPSVAACIVETPGGARPIPDHGDLWRVEWQCRDHPPQWAQTAGWGPRQGSGTMDQLEGEPGKGRVSLRGECFSLPLRLERTVTLAEASNGWRLGLVYSVTNLSAEPTPWAWAAHPLFVAEDGDRIVLPDSIKTLRLEGSRGERLGKRGAAVDWPVATLTDGSRSDLTLVQSAESGIGDKLFAGPLKEADGWCALERPKAGVRIKVGLDMEATPYLGLWLCYGGWPERPGAKQMCVAMEPATAPVDSLADTGPWSRVLPPGECFSWFMDVEIETMQREKQDA